MLNLRAGRHLWCGRENCWDGGGGIEQKREKKRTHGHGQRCGDCGGWVVENGRGQGAINGDGKKPSKFAIL